MVPSRKWRPTRLTNSTTFCSEYQSRLSTILEKVNHVDQTVYVYSCTSAFTWKLALTYIVGVNVCELACFFHRYCSWLVKICWIFSFMERTLALTRADCNSDLSIVWPLGSPILPVAPPTYNDMKHEQYKCRAHFTLKKRVQIHCKPRTGRKEITWLSTELINGAVSTAWVCSIR